MVEVPEEMYLSLRRSIRRTLTKSLSARKGKGGLGMAALEGQHPWERLWQSCVDSWMQHKAELCMGETA